MRWVFDAAGSLFASPYRMEGATFGQTQSLGLLARDDLVFRLAPALRRERLGWGGNDVVVRAGPEALDHIAVVGQAGAEK